MATQLIELGAARLAALVRDGAVSAVEVVEAHLDRIAEVDPRLHAFVELDSEGARARARAADEARARGEALGRLHGVPVSIKDWIEATGFVCAAGLAERAAYRPRRDATAVARLRAAGAIALGKTVTRDGGELNSTPVNPRAAARTPGGSSSGEAVLIAAGGSPLGLGSDSGGSVRLPAHYCGVAALKPTTGLVPSTGHFPRVGNSSDPRTTIGPMARRVEDLALALSVIAGPDGRDPAAPPIEPRRPEAADLKGLRIACFTSLDGATPDAATVEAAGRALAELGALVDHAHPPRIDEAREITELHWKRPVSISLSQWSPDRKITLTAEEVERMTFGWERFQRQMTAFMGHWDLILCPAAPTPAPIEWPNGAAQYVYLLPFSLTGQPSAVVPCGWSTDGLPIAVQLVADRWRDHLALAAAGALEASFGGWRLADAPA